MAQKKPCNIKTHIKRIATAFAFDLATAICIEMAIKLPIWIYGVFRDIIN
jgi:hypothetical protein